MRDLKARGLAEQTSAANDQHYEVPAEFYAFVMGEYKKYSCGYWPAEGMTLDQSEAAALDMVCERAQLTNSGCVQQLGTYESFKAKATASRL